MNNLLEKLVDKIDLTEKEAYNMMISIMSGNYDDIQISGMLTALRCKGETVKEITGFARAMRKKMVPVKLNVPAIDMCGTGGDSKGTFNISTAATFVVAGSGVNVAKHGNRSMTSKSGSADVLQALGISINRDINESIRDVQEVGLGFFFAPDYHPAMKHAIKPRTSLGIRTIFNILGPLCNPANVKAQAMGIFSPKLTEIQLKVLSYLPYGESTIRKINGNLKRNYNDNITSYDKYHHITKLLELLRKYDAEIIMSTVFTGDYYEVDKNLIDSFQWL